MRGLGYKLDVPDARDQLLSAKLGALATSPPPASASVERAEVHPKDQSSTSSCTGQAVSQAVRLAYLQNSVDCPELSALFAYYMGRAEYGGEHADDGSYIRSVIKGVVRLGIPDEAAWSFANERVNEHPRYKAYRAAHDRRGVRGYHRVPAGDVEGVRRAIAAGFPVVGGWLVGEDFVNWNGSGVISGQTMIVGGHAVCLTSYAADGTFRFINSWGRTWGRDGWGVCDSMLIASGTDLWAVEVA